MWGKRLNGALRDGQGKFEVAEECELQATINGLERFSRVASPRGGVGAGEPLPAIEERG